MMEERPKKLKWIQFVKWGGGGSLNEKIVSSNLVSIESMENAHYLPWRYLKTHFVSFWTLKLEI